MRCDLKRNYVLNFCIDIKNTNIKNFIPLNKLKNLCKYLKKIDIKIRTI